MICITINTVRINEVLRALKPDCYLNWRATDEFLSDKRYTPEIWRLDKNVTTWKARLQNYEGLVLFFNEPDRQDQSNTSPELAAQLVDTYTNFITNWACCGIMVNRGGLDWMNKYLQSGGKVPNVWHIHIYADSLESWQVSLQSFWTWYDLYGGNRPVIISETSLMWQPESDQVNLLSYLINFHDKRVLKIYWFSSVLEPSQPYWKGDILLDSDLKLTKLGYLINPEPTNSQIISEPKRYLTYLPQVSN